MFHFWRLYWGVDAPRGDSGEGRQTGRRPDREGRGTSEAADGEREAGPALLRVGATSVQNTTRGGDIARYGGWSKRGGGWARRGGSSSHQGLDTFGSISVRCKRRGPRG